MKFSDVTEDQWRYIKSRNANMIPKVLVFFQAICYIQPFILNTSEYNRTVSSEGAYLYTLSALVSS
jgi:hypothetical protein